MTASIPSWARPGVKVVCVRSGDWKERGSGNRVSFGPAVGDVCAISETYIKDRPFLRLREYPVFAGEKCGFDAQHFRPLVSDLTADQLTARKELFDSWLQGAGADA